MKIAILVLCCFGLSLLGGALAGYVVLTRYSAALDLPVAVVDLSGLVNEDNGKGKGLSEAYARAMTMAERLADRGYVVLDGRSVLKAPGGYYVRIDGAQAPSDAQ